MQCQHCQKEISIHREFCPHCGERITVAFDEIAVSVKDDAAVRRGRDLEGRLRLMILAAGCLVMVVVGLNDLWDRPLAFDGADLPSIDPPPATLAEPPSLLQPYRERWSAKAPVAPLPRSFGYRQAPFRDALREGNHGPTESTPAIHRALVFLEHQQTKDGSWTISTDSLRIKKERDESAEFRWGRHGLTALVVLAFLGEGETWFPNEQGRVSKYAKCIERGLAFLVQSQDETNGRLGPPEGNFMYNHGMATLALAEAAGMSGEPFLRAAAQKGVDLIERIQGNRGGWGYRDQIAERQDTSVSAWQTQALYAAREAGLKVNAEVLQKALKYYQDATDPRTGTVSYDFTDTQVRPGLYGVALMLRQLLGEGPTQPVRLLAKKSQEALPRSEKAWGHNWREGPPHAEDDRERAQTFDPYRWYFSTYGLYFYGGDEWERWHQALVRSLMELQDTDGAWRANDIWSVKAGATYSTAMSILTLQVYYRIH